MFVIRFLLKRLENFQGFELPKVKNWDTLSDSPDEDSDTAAAAARIRAELDVELNVANETSNSQSSKVNNVPPALLGPHHNETSTEMGPVTPKSQVTNGHTTPKQHPMSSSATSITLVSATVPVPVVMTTTTTNTVPTKAKKVTKSVKRDTSSTEKGATTKKRKTDIDPNAPKKPSNAFFWFCQDKRATLQEQFRGEGMAGQHDLTKALARLWSETKIEDRKVRQGSL